MFGRLGLSGPEISEALRAVALPDLKVEVMTSRLELWRRSRY
jgi:hypothetical protein